MTGPARLRSAIIPSAGLPAGVRAFTTTRASGDFGATADADAATLDARRAALSSACALPARPRWLRQVHGIDVHDADATPESDRHPVADASVTRTAGRVLAILTADCVPVVLASQSGGVLCVAHAGWRGLAAGVLEAAIGSMRRPGVDIGAWLGPAIGPRSYEVGAEVLAAFVDRDPGAEVAFAPSRPGHWRCDLYELARRRLAACGLSRVTGGGFDTFADERFFSYRRDGAASGRMATLAWLESPEA